MSWPGQLTFLISFNVLIFFFKIYVLLKFPYLPPTRIFVWNLLQKRFIKKHFKLPQNFFFKFSHNSNKIQFLNFSCYFYTSVTVLCTVRFISFTAFYYWKMHKIISQSMRKTGHVTCLPPLAACCLGNRPLEAGNVRMSQSFFFA